jgi:pyruvate formate lyase activating enzyme
LFKSVVWSSTIDYPNQVSTVLFVGTCNWDCKFCYNRNLINNESIDFNTQILPRLINRKEFINHVVISGGECTCYKELLTILNILKEKGFIVGIHTNGSNPNILAQLINKIDFIGMDIKTGSWNSYESITNTEIAMHDIIDSIYMIIKSNKEYEFRTTVYPPYVNLKDCVNIAQLLKNIKADKYILQQFDNSFDKSVVEPYSIKYLNEIKEECNKIIPTFIKGW